MVQADGMIDGRAEPLHKANPSAGVDGGAKNDFLEQI
jgi:hypothetical protein